MKRGIIVVLFISILLVSPIVHAQTYSGFDKFTDNIKLFFSFGDNKVKLALEIGEKEVDSAAENVKLGNKDQARKNLDSASNKLNIVQSKITSEATEELKEQVKEVEKSIMVVEDSIMSVETSDMEISDNVIDEGPVGSDNIDGLIDGEAPGPDGIVGYQGEGNNVVDDDYVDDTPTGEVVRRVESQDNVITKLVGFFRSLF